MIRLSVPLRQALSRLTLPVMLVLSLGTVLIGRADQGLAGRLQGAIDDVLAPVYGLVSAPVAALEHGSGTLGQLFSLQAQNQQLRAENAKLLQWQSVAMALAAQNDALKSALNYVPSPMPEFFTAHVVADLGGVYARSVLVSLPLPLPPGALQGNASLTGAVAMDGRGVAGRVVEAGGRSARVLLITDLNSRIPVALGPQGLPALMVGTNGADPALQYWSPGKPPAEGDMVLTSAEGGAFPPGLPVGVVHYNAQNDPVVLPLADIDGLRLLRLFCYPTGQPVLTPEHDMPKLAKPHRKH